MGYGELDKGPSINNVGNREGGGVKNYSKLPTDSSKKLPTWGRVVSKSGKIADVVYGWSLMRKEIFRKCRECDTSVFNPLTESYFSKEDMKEHE